MFILVIFYVNKLYILYKLYIILKIIVNILIILYYHNFKHNFFLLNFRGYTINII